MPQSFAVRAVGGEDSHTEKPFETMKVLASEPLLVQESRAHRHASKRGDRPLSSRFQTVTCLSTVLIHSASVYLVALMGLAWSAAESTSMWGLPPVF